MAIFVCSANKTSEKQFKNGNNDCFLKNVNIYLTFNENPAIVDGFIMKKVESKQLIIFFIIYQQQTHWDPIKSGSLE